MSAVSDKPPRASTEASRNEPHGRLDNFQQTPPALRLAQPSTTAHGPTPADHSTGFGASPTDRQHFPSASARFRKNRVFRHPLVVAAALALGAALATGGYLYWDYASHFESTDDAFIAARQFGVAPQVSGTIVAVPVTDNQHVKTGQVIARIDQRDYRIALAQARARVAAAKAGIAAIKAETRVQQADIAASKAKVAQAQAALIFARQQAARYQDLAGLGAGTRQMEQQTASGLRQQQAGLDTAEAALIAARAQIQTLTARRASADAALANARAQRDQAELNLSYTTIRAAQPGRVVELSAAVGEYVQPGTDLMMFVPDKVWVTANFKETELAAIRPGDPVSLHIDAYPGEIVHGKIASVQAGSGTAFSLLPAENATGNYVKEVQRVPVKVTLGDLPAGLTLGPGMSVVPTVRVNPRPSLYERLVAFYAHQPSPLESLAGLLRWLGQAT